MISTLLYLVLIHIFILCFSFYENISVSGSEDFNTDVLIRHTEMAPFPDTTSFIQKLEREREARERGDVRDNRGFFSKYVSFVLSYQLNFHLFRQTNNNHSTSTMLKRLSGLCFKIYVD